jgi:hypothetical protein
MLCDRCHYRQEIKSKEIGRVFYRCGELGLPLGKLGNVEHCTTFEDKGAPYLFANSAWRMRKDDNNVWRFVNPETGEIESAERKADSRAILDELAAVE